MKRAENEAKDDVLKQRTERFCCEIDLVPLGVDCGRLNSPENGLIRLPGTTLGSRAMYVCNRGFMLKGSAFRTCQVNGEWSGETPTCIRESTSTI